MKTKRIVIVGGGVIGLCTAWYARQKGHEVTIVERGALGHDCCSLGNAGFVTPSHIVPLAAPGMVGMGMRMMFDPESPFWIHPRLDSNLFRWGWRFIRAATPAHVNRSAPLLCEMNMASRRCFEEFDALWENEFGLQKKGMLLLCKTEERLHEEAEVAEMAGKLGLASEILTPAQTAEREPNVRMDITGAIYFADDCHMTPQKFVDSLTRHVQEQGVTIAWSSEVTNWRTNGTRIEAALTPRGDFEADEFVLSGGSWSAEIVRNLKLSLPLQAGKGYSLTHPTPRCLPTHCSILSEARVAVTPMGDTLRFGGTMELSGLDLSINPARVRGILKSVPRYLPDFSPDDFRDVPVWCGLRPCSPDGLPYVGRFGRFSNLSAATGHAMMGLSLGPITGKLMSEVLSDEPPSINIAALNPDRYA
ncbi:MAG TPA: FAD-dependent oxidoreductase [Chthonomonadaceae bacterium]|nr:FAD-dependent oxidoreductase [Chthonomonadaceae bacterium]